MSSTEGYFPHTVYFQMGSTAIVASSGAEIKWLSGGYQTMKDGSYAITPVRQNTSLVKTIIPSGISVITASTTGKAGKVVFQMSLPIKAGLCVSIVQNCTFTQIIRGSSTPKTIFFNSTKFTAMTIPNTTKGKGSMVCEMYSLTTALWTVIAALSTVGKAKPGGVCTLTTACT